MYYSNTVQEDPKLKDFFFYLEYRGYKLSPFMSFSPQKREEIFLKWKWGNSHHESNLECESTRRLLVKEIVGFNLNRIFTDEEKKYWAGILKFEGYCLEVKKKIGLIFTGKENPKEIPPEIKRVDWHD